jgi:hypothetical protein
VIPVATTSSCVHDSVSAAVERFSREKASPNQIAA